MASGTDTHNAVFQQDSSRFTFFSVSAEKLGQASCSSQQENAGFMWCRLFGLAWRPEHFLQLYPVSDFPLLILDKSSSTETVQHPAFIAEFSFTEWGLKKKKNYPDHSLEVALELNCGNFLLIHTCIHVIPIIIDC